MILESEPDKGATFKIYLPATTDSVDSAKHSLPGTKLKGNETILLVEDEEQVRDLAERILLRAGYSVILSKDGDETVKKFRQFAQNIDLIYLDVILPKLSGDRVMTIIESEQPDMPTLLTSGYSEQAVHNNFMLIDGLELLQKPYSAMQLKTKTREIMSQTDLSNQTQKSPS
ncbi:MAG: DNA-binding NtrC family response regulator [Candidatus Azotimanducaceae bacterium]